MDRNFRYIPLVIAWGLAAVFGCLFCPGLAAADPAPSIRVETSGRKVPKWVNQVPRADEEYFYFVGRATGATTLEGAEQDAAADALRQIVTMIGLTASVSYDRLRSEAKLLLEDRVSFEGDARVVGLKRLETYYEKVYYHTGDSLTTRYNASLLARYPRQSLAREKARMEQEAIQRVKMAGELLAKASQCESENDEAEALDSYMQALQEFNSPVIFLLPAELGESSDNLKRTLLTAARRLSLRQRQVAINPVMVSQTDGRSWQDAQMNAALAEAMLNHGFQPVDRAEDLPSGVFLWVSARCSEELANSLGDGFCLSRWSATISLLRPDENTILVQKVLTAKGFGPDLERASLDARHKLRQEVFAEFAQQAREKLNLTLGQDSRSRKDYNHASN